MSAPFQRAGWLTACAMLAVLFQSFFQQPVNLPLLAAVLVFTAASAWRPFDGLLVLAGLGPLAAMLMSFGRGDAGVISLAEVVTLAFLVAWTGRQTFEPEPLKLAPAVRWPALLLAVAALASAIVHSARTLVEMQAEPVPQLLRQLLRDYVIHAPGSEPVAAAAVLACGMLLLLATAQLTAGSRERRSAVLRMMVCGAAGAALLNVARLLNLAVQREHPLPAFFELLATVRVNVHYADRNAAGSVFAMVLMLAVAIGYRERLAAGLTAPWIAAGLWISGSRFALAGATIGLIAGLVTSSRRVGRRGAVRGAILVLVALIVAGAAAWTWYPEGRNIKAAKAFAIRVELARAGVAMAAAEPIFGVGLSRFYALSNVYAGEALEALGFVQENAHNNFVQLAAELGLPAFLAFVVLIGASFRELFRPVTTAETRWLGAGLAAYLLTCLGGHPLLVTEAAFPFWLALGVAAAPATEPPPGTSPRWRYLFAVLMLALGASAWPRTAAAVRSADLERVSFGLSKWQHQPDGQRFRWAGGRSTFYVTSAASAVRIPLWNGAADRRTIEVQILMNGREVNRILLPADDLWRVARIIMRTDPLNASTRFDLIATRPGETEPLAIDATDTGGAIKVGRPEVEQ